MSVWRCYWEHWGLNWGIAGVSSLLWGSFPIYLSQQGLAEPILEVSLVDLGLPGWSGSPCTCCCWVSACLVTGTLSFRLSSNVTARVGILSKSQAYEHSSRESYEISSPGYPQQDFESYFPSKGIWSSQTGFIHSHAPCSFSCPSPCLDSPSLGPKTSLCDVTTFPSFFRASFKCCLPWESFR